MAGRGPAPKDPSKRQRRNKDVVEETVLDADEAAEKELGPLRDVPEGEWHSKSRDYWNRWASSLQARQFIETDWIRLEMLMPLVDAYYRNPTTQLMGEIRLNEAKLGGTPEDRLRLRWRMRASDQELEREEKQAAAGGAPASKRADPRLALIAGGKK